MKKILIGIAFVMATIFTSCSDTITEENQTQAIDKVEKDDFSDSSRCGFSCHGGRVGGNSISGHSSHCSYRD